MTGGFWEQLLGRRPDSTVFFGGGVGGRESLRERTSPLFFSTFKTAKASLAVILLPGLFSQQDSMTVVHNGEGCDVFSICQGRSPSFTSLRSLDWCLLTTVSANTLSPYHSSHSIKAKLYISALLL